MSAYLSMTANWTMPVGGLRRVVVMAGSVAMLLARSASGQSNSLEANAKALLEAKCLACHGEASMSGLDLRALETLRPYGRQ